MVKTVPPFRQGDVWWADLPEPQGSEPGFRRPLLIVQRDSINRSQIQTIVCVVITSNLRLAEAPGNVLLEPQHTGLPKPSVANVSQLLTTDKRFLIDYAGTVPHWLLDKVLDGVEFVIGR